MTQGRDEDLFEGEFGPRKSPTRGGRGIVPDVSVTGGNKRGRAAWYTRSQGIRGRLFDIGGQSVVTNADGAIVPENSLPAGSAGVALASISGVFLHRPQQHLWDVSGMIPQVMLTAPGLNNPATLGPTRFRVFVRDVCTPLQVWRGELLDAQGAAMSRSEIPMDTPMGRFRYRSEPRWVGWFPDTWPESTAAGAVWPCGSH